METTRAPLPFRTTLAYGIGEGGEVVFLGMFNTFIVIYYNQAIGLSNSLIGTAMHAGHFPENPAVFCRDLSGVLRRAQPVF